MTEAEWLACTDPVAMLNHLRPGRRHRPSERKLRLIGCAWCRHIWHLLVHPLSRQAVEMAEQYSDGTVDKGTLRKVEEAARDILWRGKQPWTYPQRRMEEAASDVAYEVSRRPFSLPRLLPCIARAAAIQRAVELSEPDAELSAQMPTDVQNVLCVTLRDTLGNPFQLVTLDPSWLTWRDGTIPKLAEAIYDDRAFDRLPILGDALEDAGCDNADILHHCRGSGPHVRGCWVIDLLLGKE